MASYSFGQGSVLPGFWDLALWGTAVFLVIARLAYNLEINMVQGYYKSILGVGLLIAICSMAIGVCLAIAGFVGVVALIPISTLLVTMCVLFSNDFFTVDRRALLFKVLMFGFIVGLFVGVAGFIL